MDRLLLALRALFSRRSLAGFGLALSLTLAAVAVSVVTGAPEQVEAQRSGGSFGGSNWGGGSRSSGSRSSGSRSSGSRSTPSYGGSTGYSSPSRSSYPSGVSVGGTRTRRSGGGLGGILCFALVLFGFVGLVLLARRRGSGSGGALGADSIAVTQLQLGLDWRARPQLQAQFAQLAQSGDTQSPEGLMRLLSETMLALRRNEISWLYVGYRDLGGLPPDQAQMQFQQLANDARARFQTETIRGHEGHMQILQAPEVQAQANEGKGTVVVTVVVASRRALEGVNETNANSIRAALADRGALTPDDLAAMEVIWSPSVDGDRLSTSELEQFYPEMRLIDPNSIAGRIFCAYCNAPFPMELLNCTNCGAPAEASKDRRAPPT